MNIFAKLEERLNASKPTTEESIIAEGKRWNKLKPATRWIPQSGDVISGKYLGLREHTGEYGDYKSVLVDTSQGTFSASGVLLIDVVENSALVPGDIIMLVYKGRSQGDHGYKHYEVYVEDSVVARRHIA